MSNLIPVPRKEQYLSKIDGMTNKSPDKTYTKEEYFFSEILGEALHKPVLETRYEMYLAKIAGREIGIPYPETRLERFLAKACGMDIETPTPITREEIFWSNYSAIVEFEVEGVPPLTYKAIEGTLENYRIYGNTVDGESVGDRTANLFDCDNTEDTEVNGIVWSCKNQIITANGATGNLSSSTFGHKRITGLYGSFILACVSDTNNDCICVVSVQETQSSARTYNISTTNSYATFSLTGEEHEVIVYAQVNKNKEVNNAQFFISLTEGSTPPDTYEPYGYKVPVTVEWKSFLDYEATIYLPEPIKMVGDEAEYIDYGEQKQHRVGADDLDVTLPALPTIKGTNVLSVGTEVQPSKVYVKYKGERQ